MCLIKSRVLPLQSEETAGNAKEGVWLLILKAALGWAVKGSSGAQEELYQIPCQVMSLVLSS